MRQTSTKLVQPHVAVQSAEMVGKAFMGKSGDRQEKREQAHNCRLSLTAKQLIIITKYKERMENSLPPKETNNFFFFFLQPLNRHGEGVQDVGAARGRCPRRSPVAGVVMWGDKGQAGGGWPALCALEGVGHAGMLNDHGELKRRVNFWKVFSL